MGRMPMPNQHILRDIIQFNFNNDFIPNMHLRCEMLNGDIIPVPIPAIRHQAISLKIASALLQYAEARRLGRVLPAPCNVILSKNIVMQPDIVFIKNERRGLIGVRSLRGAPDLVVEVLSPAVRKRDLKAKKRIYERFEVQEYWLVDPDAAAVEAMIWSELGYISVCSFDKSDKLSSPLLPNLNLDLSRVFETG
jgi:Uma2 family endonuclease